MKKKLTILQLLFFIAMTSFSQEAYYVTFGKDCPSWWGDDDNNQVFFISVAENSQPFYLWIQDPDVGGKTDEINKIWDTKTHFALFGGEGAYTNKDAQSINPTTGLKSGKLIKEQTYGVDASTDNKWVKWGPYNATQGEKVGNNYIFKLSVHGIEGDDGNLFKLFVSSSKSEKISLANHELFTHEVTFRFPYSGTQDVALNIAPAKKYSKLTFYNFDVDNAGGVSLFSPNNQKMSLEVSANDEWAKTTKTFEGSANSGYWNIFMSKKVAGNNDAVFYTLYDDGTPVPIVLPLTTRYTPQMDISQKVQGCNTYLFDASKTTDLNLGDKLTYHWDYGDGATGKGKYVSHEYKQSGNYPITLTVRDNSGTVCSVSHSTVNITVNTPPVADAGVDAKGCPSEELTFNGAHSYDVDGQIKYYKWDFGDGNTAQGAKVTHRYEKPGKYKAKLTVIDDSESGCDTDMDAINVVINEAPVANAGPDQRLANTTVKFDGTKSYDPDNRTANALIYEWDFGDGTPVTYGPKPIHNYKKPGEYKVTLKVRDRSGTDCDTDIDDLIVFINEAPVADAGSDKNVCRNDEIQFSAANSSDKDGELSKYTWNFGDGNTATGKEVSHSYAEPGMYSVELKVTDNSGLSNNTDVHGSTVTVNASPIAEAGRDIVVCTNETFELDGSKSYDPDGHITEYAWDFGDGNSGSGEIVSHSYSKPGVYMSTLRVKDNSNLNCGTDQDEVHIIVNEPPVAIAGEDILTCEAAIDFDGSESYDRDGRILSYIWDFGDGASGSGASPTHLYAEEGTYKVTLKVTDNSGTKCNTATDELTLTINASPKADAGTENITACPGENISLDGTKSSDSDGQIVSYSWDFGDGSEKSSDASTSHSYDKPGNYVAKLTVKDNSDTECNVSYDEVYIHINETPVAEAGPDKVSCEGQNVTFSGSASYDTEGDLKKYQWNFGDGNTAEGQNVEHIYNSKGTYNVKLTVTDKSGTKCNTASDETSVEVLAAPKANAGQDIETCEMNVHFDGSGSKNNNGGSLIYQWNFGDGTPEKGGQKPSHKYKEPGNYEVTLTVSDENGYICGSDQDKMLVTIYEAPVANAGPNHRVCIDEEIKFDGSKSYASQNEISSYEWDFGDGNTAEGKYATHAYSQSGVYQVTLTVTDQNNKVCPEATASSQVLVNAAPIAEAGSDKFGCVNESLLFNAGNSIDNDGKIISYHWNFGDGTSAYGAQVRHKYAKAGNYDVELSVVDDSKLNCKSDKDNLRVTIKQPPVAKAGEKQRIACIGCAQDEVEFDASGSYDPDGDGLSYHWDFGDGAQAEGIRVTHAYTKPGNYTVVLTVTDNSGLKCNKDTYKIQVKANIAPDPVINVRSKDN